MGEEEPTAPLMGEQEALGVLGRTVRRLRWMFAVVMLLSVLGYGAVQLWIREDTLRGALVSALVWGAFYVPVMWFVATPRYVRRRASSLVPVTVLAVDGRDLTLGASGQHPVRLTVPPGTRGFRGGDEVWVFPGLEPGATTAVVVPAHVTARRPVIASRPTAV